MGERMFACNCRSLQATACPGASSTPKECVEDWVRLAINTGTHINTFRNHLLFMLAHALTRAGTCLYAGVSVCLCVCIFK
jgi:hypothetical protein